jgi:hypothetical protein
MRGQTSKFLCSIPRYETMTLIGDFCINGTLKSSNTNPFKEIIRSLLNGVYGFSTRKEEFDFLSRTFVNKTIPLLNVNQGVRKNHRFTRLMKMNLSSVFQQGPLDCFIGMKSDVLVMDNWRIIREKGQTGRNCAHCLL